MKSKNTTGYNFSGMGMGGGPVFEIDQRQQRARRTKDIWEDQKAGRPKNLTAEEARRY